MDILNLRTCNFRLLKEVEVEITNDGSNEIGLSEEYVWVEGSFFLDDVTSPLHKALSDDELTIDNNLSHIYFINGTSVIVDIPFEDMLLDLVSFKKHGNITK